MKVRVRRRHRRGFTLMEILLVMAILVVLASMSTFAFLTFNRNARRDATLNEIRTLSNACIMYKMRLQRFPAKLDDLFVQPQGLTSQEWRGPYLTDGDSLDPWGNPFQYSADEANDRVIISSAGPDGQAGTEDDVSNAPGSRT
jgi:general secretion pathway protein G